jgi:hypothetical protein
MTRTLLTAIFLTLFSQTAWAGEQESANPFAGVYFGLQHSKYNIKATATKPGASPYSIKTDSKSQNTGFVLGYNHAFGSIVTGLEISRQGGVATDSSSSEWAGTVQYSDLSEYKIRIGYQFGEVLPYISYGVGDIKIQWSGYPNADPSTSGYNALSFGFDYILSKNVLIGLEISKANVEIYYPTNNWTEDTDLSSTKFKISYLF